MKVCGDLRNLVMIQIPHPSVIHVELLAELLVSALCKPLESSFGSGDLVLGIPCKWLVGIDEKLRTWLLINDLEAVHADAQGQVFTIHERLGMIVTIFGFGVSRWKIARQDAFVHTFADNTFSWLDTDVG